jgi:hypothetical protein
VSFYFGGAALQFFAPCYLRGRSQGLKEKLQTSPCGHFVFRFVFPPAPKAFSFFPGDRSIESDLSNALLTTILQGERAGGRRNLRRRKNCLLLSLFFDLCNLSRTAAIADRYLVALGLCKAAARTGQPHMQLHELFYCVAHRLARADTYIRSTWLGTRCEWFA